VGKKKIKTKERAISRKRPPFICSSALEAGSTTGYEVKHEYCQRDNQQQVDESAANVCH
jgi:hypothetical protein